MAVGVSPGELRELTDEELTERLRESKEELFNLRFQLRPASSATTAGSARCVRKSRASTRCCANANWVWRSVPMVPMGPMVQMVRNRDGRS